MTKSHLKAPTKREAENPALNFFRRPAERSPKSEATALEKIASKVVRFRSAEGVSQAELAKRAGISRKLVNEIEGQINTNPSLKSLEALAKAMLMPLEKLVA